MLTDPMIPVAALPRFLDVDGRRIAVRRQEGGEGPELFWLGGWRSDMRGTKAEALAALAREKGWGFTRHDYSGHGESEGSLAEGTITRWLGESLAVLRAVTRGGQVLVASSMGAWIALRMAAELREERGRVAGMVLVAPAPDFTSELVEPAMGERERDQLARHGFFTEPSDYGPEPNVWTGALLEDGRRNRVLTGPIHTHCPVHVIQGMRDADVPHAHALRLVSLLPADDVTLTLVPDGDHRLSRAEDIALIGRAVEGVVAQAAAAG